ncbi:DNA mismatch repair protein msh6 [Tilletia horrida]|uniref:DNA mismatch repair protein msh6 n=1 Tax=Tilletia horrida TaxID=155126 RepID=A0AAN6JN40_9BASI|nr:DNA mismatch repair protein msh6 [Tilletia horrida]
MTGNSNATHSTREAPPQTPARRVLANQSNTLSKGMPPKKTGSSGGASAAGGGKQLSLLGFFAKASGPAAAAPASASSKAATSNKSGAGSSSSSGSAAASKKVLTAKDKAAALVATTEALQTPPPTTDRPKSSSSGATSRAAARPAQSQEPERASSPPLSSPLNSRSAQKAVPALSVAPAKASAPAPMDLDDDDDDDDDDDAVVSFSRRRGAVKRTINYAESEDEDQGDSDVEAFKPPAKSKASSSASARPAKKARSSKARADDDDFIVADDDVLSDHASVGVISDDDNDDAAVEEEENDEPAPKLAARKKATSKAAPSRSQAGFSPPASSNNAFSAMSGGGHPGTMQKSSSLSHLTKAERRVAEEKRKKAANEEAYSFLVDLRDKDGNRPGDENYDSRTVYIPKNAWKDFTPFETQFWTIKQNHWDTVLFFQKGKFYELYEEDALIGHREFDLKLTDRVKMKMVGVPEHSFEIFAAKFLALGYKVGRVDQMETAVAKGMRTGEKSRGGGSEIVRRELRHVLTSGTIVDTSALPDDMSSYCIAIKEVVESDSPLAQPDFGVCTLDAATAEFSLTSFKDDASRTKFETLLRSLRLREVLYEKGKLSKATLRLLKNTIPSSCQITQLRSGTEFLNRAATMDKLNTLFGAASAANAEDDDDDDANESSEKLDPTVLPEAIRSMLKEDNAVAALGAMLWYLTQLNLDKDLCASRNFNIFDPLRKRQCLVLDAQSLSHLNVLQNDRGDDEGTLHRLLNRCITPFGKRLFKIWLVSPLADARAINARLDAVDDFMRDTAFEDAFGAFARKLPDIERIMPRIHAGKAKPRDFTNVLNAFTRFARAVDNLAEIAQDFETSTIRDLLSKMPDVTSKAEMLKSTFDVEEDGSFVPRRGEHEDYDDAADNLDRIESELKKALENHAKTLKLKVGKQIKFKDVGTKEIYQVEVPKNTVVPKSWATVSSTKNEARYYPEDVRDLVQELKEGRETRLAALKDFMQVTFAAFREDSRDYTAAIKTIAEVDCLLSLAKASYAMGEPTCRPEFVESEAAEIEFKELRHPCIANTTSADFIPNDIALGGEQDEMIILTGGNMAGKSTTARTAATAVIIAQMGCRVPAAFAKLAPVDRIASRMGANDQLFKNNSTFMVEMLEAARIISECTPRSLVIMDELGRGTSTFDGQAIAYAVLHHLVGRTRCLGFFLTHYTTLAHDFSSYPRVSNKHMEVLVDDKAREVVFTYRLVPGIAESSYGTQVAALAGVPHEICDRAEAVSKEFMESIKRQQAERSVSSIPVSALSDVSYLFKLAERETAPAGDEALLLSRQLSIMKAQIAMQGTNAGATATASVERASEENNADVEMTPLEAENGDAATEAATPRGPPKIASYAGRNKRRWQAREGNDEVLPDLPYLSSNLLASSSRTEAGESSLKQKASSSSRTFSATSRAENTAPKMEQMILDFGQKTTVSCSECGMSYDRSSADDRTLHQKHHERITKGLEWTSASLVNAGKMLDLTSHQGAKDAQILLYNLDDGPASLVSSGKMRELLASVDDALGAAALPEDTLRRCKVLVARQEGRAVGAAVIGRVRPGSARRVVGAQGQTPGYDACSGAGPGEEVQRADVGGEAVFVSEPLPDSSTPPIGLHRIHVVPALRRTGLASLLLDAVLAHGVYGQTARDLEAAYGGRAGVLAFSQPTQSGKKLAEAWLAKGQDQGRGRELRQLIVFEE